MEPAQAAEILRQTLLALGHAHHQGFVHRDIKPENLLVTQDGVVKVADFGLARAYADGRVTQAGAVTGTVQYLAPEQIRGEPADPRSDLYSLGIVAYELLTGKLPFTGETAMAVAYKHLSDSVPAPSSVLPDLPNELDGFVAAATDRDRELRPESADVMRMDLEVISHQLSPARKLSSLVADIPSVTVEGGETTEVGVRLETAIPRMERHRKRRRFLKRVVGAVLLVAMLSAAAWGTWTYAIPHTAVIPALVGETVDDATDRLTALGFDVTRAPGEYSMQVPDDHVKKILPVAGAERDVGTTVTIVPSLGPPPVKVPTVRGDLLKDARQAIAEAGLLVEAVRHRFDGEVREGRVIGVRPDTARLPRGTSVTLIVSDGPKPVAIPDVSGMPEDKAVQTLLAKGLRGRDRGGLLGEGRPWPRDRHRSCGWDRAPAGRDDRAADLARTGVLRLPQLRGHERGRSQDPGGERGPEAHGAPGPGQQRQQHRQPAPARRHPRSVRLHDHRLLRVILGAHVRRRQTGIEGALEEAALRAADCLQIFVSNPRAWAPPRYDEPQIERFRGALEASGLRPCVAHLSYVGNVASWDPTTLGRTRELIVETVHACDALGVDLLVVHAGAGGPQDRGTALRSAAESFRLAVGEAERTHVLVELMAGTSGAVASVPSEAEELCAAVGDDRLGIRLDTAHLFAAGVHLDTASGVHALSQELRERALAPRLGLVHANDSVFERGARRDRHADIGDGLIGDEGWRALANDPLVGSVPWILETPGDADRQREDIARLRRLAAPD